MKMIAQNTSKSKTTQDDNDSDSDEPRSRQVIIHGFEAGSDEAGSTTFINKLLQDNSLTEKAEKVFTFTDPTSIGVIQFRSIAAKSGFFKKTHNVKIKSPHDDKQTVILDGQQLKGRAGNEQATRLLQALPTHQGKYTAQRHSHPS